ncbi:hypothetical protein ACFW04_005549 [Cataglyphis niger]
MQSHTDEWILRIRYPQRKDSGIYECQISTTPPIGHPVHLNIVVASGKITGNSCSSRTWTLFTIDEFEQSHSCVKCEKSKSFTICKKINVHFGIYIYHKKSR